MSGDWKPNRGQKIERLYAWIATEPDGGEGICSVQMSSGIHMPMIGADRARIESFRGYVKSIAQITGRQIRLVRFETRIEEEAL